MPLTFIDCQGFAGAFAFGAQQAGFQLLHKAEDKGGFGIPAFEANRHIFGQEFTTQASAPADWDVQLPVDLVIGNPPCSGFSPLNTVKGSPRSRGAGSQINQCMHNFWDYVARCRPQIAIMESVQAAYTQGQELMAYLVSSLSEKTGQHYKPVHVLQNNLSVGGCADRPRYFLVATRVPFGVEAPFQQGDQSHYMIPTLYDAIGDLSFQRLQWEVQEITSRPSWWASGLRLPSGRTDGHMPVVNAHYRRLMDLVRGDRTVEWHYGETELQVLQRYWDTWASLPESWDYMSKPKDGMPAPRSEVLVKREFKPHGFSSVLAWPFDRPARVLTGAGPSQWFNAYANRMPTHRECARIMGYPDWWQIEPMKDVSGLGAYWGKQTSVHPAYWICQYAKSSILGQPGSLRGLEAADGSHVINVTHNWKAIWKRQQHERV